MKELTVKAETALLDEVTDFVNAELDELGCPMKAVMQIDLAVEEIFVNIASYAYRSADDPDKNGGAVIRVESAEPGTGDPNSRSVRITFEDRGIPFDPTAREDPDRSAGADERQIGGLGIFLTKTLMDEVVYEYREGKNILSFSKKTGVA